MGQFTREVSHRGFAREFPSGEIGPGPVRAYGAPIGPRRWDRNQIRSHFGCIVMRGPDWRSAFALA